MNFLLKTGYISKLLALKADAQYSKATQTKLQDRNTTIQTQNKTVFT